MYINYLAFYEVLRDLRGTGSISLPVEVVPAFIDYCNYRGVYPCGGALCGSESAQLQFLYLDK